jgi:hypothetical protein
MSGLWRGWISLEGGNGLYTGSFSLWNGDSGLIDDPVEGAAPVLTAPTLTLTSDVGRRPVTWNSSADDTIFAGYVYRLQVATNSDRTGIVQDISHDIVGGELNGASSSYDLSGDGYSEPPVGTFYYFARYERDDGEVSAWAGPMTVVVYDFVPSAFSFTDLTSQTTSTLVTSSSITVLGVSSGATCNWTVTGSGFEARVNGTGSWATSGTCVLNDTIQLRGTTSASYSTGLNGVLDIEGVTDTWTITTEASPAVAGATIGPVLDAYNVGFGSNYHDFTNVTLTAGEYVAFVIGGFNYSAASLLIDSVDYTSGLIDSNQSGSNRIDAIRFTLGADVTNKTVRVSIAASSLSAVGVAFVKLSNVDAGAPTVVKTTFGYVPTPRSLGSHTIGTDGIAVLCAACLEGSGAATWTDATEIGESTAGHFPFAVAKMTASATPTVDGTSWAYALSGGIGLIFAVA